MELNNGFIGYFDIFVFISLIIINIIFLKYKTSDFMYKFGCWLQLFIIVLFALILPILSITVEIEIVNSKYGLVDSFNLLYTYFRFPIYWVVGIIQLIVYRILDN
jgi:hypothetical protein